MSEHQSHSNDAKQNKIDISTAGDVYEAGSSAFSSSLQRAITDPNKNNLTPDMVERIQRIHGNQFAANLVAQTRRDSPSSLPIQRMFNVVSGNPIGPQNMDQKEQQVHDLIEALKTHGEQLKQYETKKEEHLVETYLEHENLKETVIELFENSVDYGRIDPENIESLSLIYFKIKQKLDPKQTKGQKESEDEEIKAQEKKLREAKNWEDYQSAVRKEIKLEDQEIVKLAILGRGASIGYYLANNAASIDPSTTKVIGLDNPWAGQRGGGVINHPKNMIVPENDTETLKDEEGLTDRGEFATIIEEVIKRIGETNIINAAIESVEKNGHGPTSHYKITTSEGVFYAQNVVAGMGIGGHSDPGKITGRDSKITDTNFKRVMNMDEFQVEATNDRLTPEQIPNGIVIVGPNAAIDVMTTAIRKKFIDKVPVHWIVSGGRPAFLGGTDNIYAQDRYQQTVPEKSKEKIFRQDNLIVYKYDHVETNATSDGVEVGYGPDRNKKPEGTINADIMVYGMGPDVGALKKTLGFKDSKDFEAIYDQSQTFNYERISPRVLKTMLEYDITKLNGNNKQKAQKIISQIEGVLGEFKEIEHKDELPQSLPQVLGLKSKTKEDDPTSMQIIGGSASRIASDRKSPMKYTYVSEMLNGLINDDLVKMKSKTAPNKKGYDSVANGLIEKMEEYLNFAALFAAEIEQAGEMSEIKDSSDKTDQLLKRHKATIQANRETFTLMYDEKLDRDPEVSEHYHQLEGLYKSGNTGHRQLRELRTTFEESKYANRISTQMKGVNSSLPQNVLLNDQLTPTRSGIEALSNNLKSNLKQGVNFISSNQNVIGAHIARKYENITSDLANYITASIVAERRMRTDVLPKPINDPNMENPESPFTVSDQKKFVDDWNRKISDVNKILDPAALKE